MVYNTTGKSHKNGLNGEKLTQEIVSTRTTRTFGEPKNVELRGGTQYKEDLFIPATGQKISCKNRQSKGGTYDYMNSSKMFSELAKTNSSAKELQDYVSSVKGSLNDTTLVRSSPKIQEKIGESRRKIKELVGNLLNSLTSEEIGNLVTKSVSDYSNSDDFYFTVTHGPTNELRIFSSRSLPVIQHLLENKPERFELKGRAASRTVLFGEQKKDYGVRLRVGLNNGVGALLGGKKLSSNPSSVLVIKIQQDNPDGQFNSIDESLVEVVKIEK